MSTSFLESVALLPDAGYSVERTVTHGPPAGGHRALAIQGSLEEAPLPDVIQLLSLGRKTGCLSLSERDMEGEICLEDGRVCHAAVFGRRDRLGDMLVRTGRITQEQLDGAVARQRAGGKRVSEALVESGQLEQPELEEYVRRQVEEAVYFMFTWRTGTFAFASSVRPKHREIPVSIDPEGLLLEGARRVDEWSLIAKKIPTLDLVFRLDRGRLEATKPALTPEQEQIVPLIDGSRNVNGLIELSGIAEFTVGKALFGLITAGFVSRVERRTAMRHLDYREMLAYVVREAEFADTDRRRAAARHIADCATCTQRLKAIHVRRTGAVPAFQTGDAGAADEQGHAAGAGTATAPVGPDGIERRVADRRSWEERRGVDRRRGERRVSRSADWERPGRDRRSGRDRRVDPRRVAERRIGAADEWQRAAAAVAARATPVPQWSRGPERRSTGPRRVRHPESDPDALGRDDGDGGRQPVEEASAPAPEPIPTDRPARQAPPAAASGVAEATIVVTPRKPQRPQAPAGKAAEATSEVTPERPPAPRRTPDPEIPEPPAGDAIGLMPNAPPQAAKQSDTTPDQAVPESPPEQHRRPARTTDIEWVVSPKEANHLLRTSRAGLAGVEPGQPIPAPDATGEPTEREQAARKPVAKLVDQESARKAAVPAAGERTVARRVARKAPVARHPDDHAAGRAAAEPSVAPTKPAERPVVRPPARIAARKASLSPAAAPMASVYPATLAGAAHPRRVGRWVAVAASVAVLAGAAWVARPFLGLGGADPLPRAAPPPTAVEAPAQSPTETGTQDPQAVASPTPMASTAPPAAGSTPAVRDPVQPPAAPPPTPPAQDTRVPAPPVRESAPPVRESAPPVAVQPAPVPAVGVVRGVVRDAQSGTALAGVRISIPGTALTATTDASGAYAIPGVPAGRIAVAAGQEGRVPGRREVMLERGGELEVDFVLAKPEPPRPAVAQPPAPPAVAPTAREADDELAAGGWTVSDAAGATARLRTDLATIPGLWVESIAIAGNGSRPRARVALLTSSGERIVLTETRSGAPALGGAPRVTALRIVPASDAYPLTTGTASFGGLLVTAKTSLPGDSLRALLGKLAPLE